jgi:tetratricopeptide (TPR) repeat protein
MSRMADLPHLSCCKVFSRDNCVQAENSTSRKLPTLLGFALDHLIKAHGWTSKQLASRAGVAPSTISAYIWGESLERERLEELAALMGLEPAAVERSVLAARLALPPEPAPWSPVDPTEEERRIAEKAAALAGSETMDLVLEIRLREIREENRQRDLEKGRELARQLQAYSASEQRDLIEGAPDFQHWGLAAVLCTASEAMAPRSPAKALELAERALFVARHVAGTEAFRRRLEGWCTGFVGNAQRVIGSNLPAAGRTFDRARRLWSEGEDPAGLFSEAHLLDMEASLRRAQGLFPLARKLLDEALALARPEEVGVFLLNKACIYQAEGEHVKALETLEKAAEVNDGNLQPRLRFGVRFNQASNLLRLDRAAEAALIIDDVRSLAEKLRNEIDLLKVLWLEGNCAAGLGKWETAQANLEQVRREFEARELPFNYALVSLDLALHYRAGGHLVEIKFLAAEMLRIFKAQGVHREAVAAVMIFQEAAQKEQVTVALLRRLQAYLAEAKANPAIKFEP